eukprot:1754193-Alexandrium_andersonii.AAC.1
MVCAGVRSVCASRHIHRWHGCEVASARVGQAKVPGPGTPNMGCDSHRVGTQSMSFATINVTALRPQLAHLCATREQ